MPVRLRARETSKEGGEEENRGEGKIPDFVKSYASSLLRALQDFGVDRRSVWEGEFISTMPRNVIQPMLRHAVD